MSFGGGENMACLPILPHLFVFQQFFSYYCTATIKRAFYIQFQPNFKTKRAAFTEILFSLRVGPL